MKKIFNHKKKIIIIVLILFFVLIGLVSYTTFNNKKIDVTFYLKGFKTMDIEVFGSYKETGAILLVDGEEKSKEIKIASKLNLKKVGRYEIKYSYTDDNEEEYIIYRVINVVDKIAPTITLEGDETINLLLNEEYKEPGYKIEDNYDKGLHDLVIIDSNVDVTKEGEYIIKYTITDHSNNTTEKTRKVIVTKPRVIQTYVEERNAEQSPKKDITSNTNNTVTTNKFTNTGLYFEGYVKNSNGNYKLKLVNANETKEINLVSIDNNNFKGEININDLANGSYKMYLLSNAEEELLNKMDTIDRIARTKINNKLVTMNYNNDVVSFSIEDFNYQYDILIDAGHGGIDPGAITSYIEEKTLNLIISKYEQCRYEEHGLRVFMVRNDDTYGTMLGDPIWRNLSKRAYTIGYYGTVSKIAYSNHHNSSNDPNLSGYELLTPSYYPDGYLNTERNIVSEFNGIYPLTENHNRFYAKDYDSEIMYSTLNGEKYVIKDNYAIIRVPHLLFNTNVVIYEAIYMSNDNDFSWYWNNQNWKKVSEIKIKKYVTSLGVAYKENSSC